MQTRRVLFDKTVKTLQQTKQQINQTLFQPLLWHGLQIYVRRQNNKEPPHSTPPSPKPRKPH